MVDVTDRAHVYVGLGAFKLAFCHGELLNLYKLRSRHHETKYMKRNWCP
jgi:hypothetical protein